MTRTLEAPTRMRSREQARALVDGIPPLDSGTTVDVVLPADCRVATSFLDQLISSLLIDRNAERLRFIGMTSEMRATARLSASTLGVSSRVSFAE